ncbi:MAG: hypothetical protein EBV24_03895 [Actinobacteria bacterium]|nr:hypothetical protein [Actinomycetota bacterium]
MIMSDTETPRLAGIFSIASGLVHGVAAGLHADHAAAARSFAVLAIVQVVAGLAGLFSGDQRVRILVAGANVVSIGGWIAAKTVGIGFIKLASTSKASMVSLGNKKREPDNSCSTHSVTSCAGATTKWPSTKGGSRSAMNAPATNTSSSRRH